MNKNIFKWIKNFLKEKEKAYYANNNHMRIGYTNIR